MTALLLASLTGIFFGIMGAYSKSITRFFSPVFLTWAVFAFAIPYIAIPVLYSGIPEIDWPTFAWATFTSFAVNLVSVNLYFRALSLSPLSLTMPFTAFTPLFMVPIAFFLFGEQPSGSGFGGILLIIAGAYGIHLKSAGILAPFRNLVKERGSLYMLTGAIIWAISGTADKAAVLSSSPEFYGLAIHIMLAGAYLPFALLHDQRQQFRHFKLLFSGAHLRRLVILGSISGIMLLCQFSALQLMDASYVIAFKRAGVIVSILIGALWFKEKDFGRNLTMTLIIVAGVILIAL